MISIFTYIMSRVTHSEPGLPMPKRQMFKTGGGSPVCKGCEMFVVSDTNQGFWSHLKC